jgi:hypothetical protein
MKATYSSPSATADGRKTALAVLMLTITMITVFQLGIYTTVIGFYLSYVIPPFAALVATFLCALINLLFHRYFEKHHLRLLYLTTSLPFLLFATAILLKFFEGPFYTIPASIIAVCSLGWYAVLLRDIVRTSTIET